ncbi:hypothetical protein [Daejeonella oryzae]|uniref:hypothetical protein n=1 Tax=Daejeonella oryzae TaxID=1122943 RepID=UPI00042286CA|nr:hypothetical protein [Daejeonella oryzae]
MKKKAFFIVIVLSFVALHSVNSQTKAEIDELKILLQSGKYVSLVNRTSQLRKKEYYKNAFMDYCLAVGYCRLNKPELSTEWFNHILNSYDNLSGKKRSELKQLNQSCMGGTAIAPSVDDMKSFLKTIGSEVFEGPGGAGIESKMGIPSASARVEELDFENLSFDTENRKFNLNEKAAAEKYYSNLINDESYRSDTTANLLIFYPNSKINISAQIKALEEYYLYFKKEFKLQEVNRLITVFYCPNRTQLNLISSKIHKIKIPESTFGYASSADLVMMGIANFAWLGAMKHELFHLMIKSFVGDIPAWLDEGTACYFESSNLSSNKLTVNLRNYRSDLLRKSNMLKSEYEINSPPVTSLVNYNWQQFSGKPGDRLIQSSLHYSYSFAFVAFIASQNKLNEVMEAYRNRTTEEKIPGKPGEEDLTVLHIRSNSDILTQVLGMPMDDIQKNFESWCTKSLGFNPYK